MNLHSNPAPAESADFHLLRARLEAEVARPAVVSITSSGADDGKEFVARGLAGALAAAGYPTLIIDTSRQSSKTVGGLSFEELAIQALPGSNSGVASALFLGDACTQKTCSQRDVLNALTILRSKFEYIVISTDNSVSPSFAESLLVSADAVMVTVKRGRRQTTGDARLAVFLERLGDRFLGVLAIDPKLDRRSDDYIPSAVAASESLRTKPAHVV